MLGAVHKRRPLSGGGGLSSADKGGEGGLRLGTHLFVKVPRPGNNEVTFSVFESSCNLLLPV